MTDAAVLAPAEPAAIRRAPPALEVDCSTDPARLDAALAAEMTALIAGHASDTLLYLTPEYLGSYFATFSDRRFLLCTARLGGQLVGAAFFDHGLRGDALVLRFAGEGLWGYSGVLTRGRDLAAEVDVVAALLRAALAFSRPAELELGPLHPSMFDLHAAAAARLGWRAQVFRIHGGAPFIDCPRTDRQAWERSRKKAARSDILRCEKRLAEAGSLAIFQLDNAALNAGSARVAMAGFLGMYHRQWAQNRFRREPRWLDFYQRLAVAGAQAGTLEFSFVTLDGQPVAAHYGFVHKARRYYFTPTYDVDLGRFSPGKVLLRRLVEGSFDRGEVFDFQNDLEPYKLDWSTGVADRFVIKLWP